MKTLFSTIIALLLSIVVSVEADAKKKRCDLVVKKLNVPSSAVAGDSIRITTQVKNKGKKKARKTYTTLYLSEDSNLDSSDKYLGRVKVKPLKKGKKSRKRKVNVTIPSWVPSGIRYVIAKADGTKREKEKREKNNYRVRAIEIGDLSISSVVFNDANLEACVNEHVVDESLTNVSELTKLRCWQRGISDLTGIESLPNLESLNLYSNNISDIRVLAHLTNLRTLYLGNNNISDINVLAGLTNLQDLGLGGNNISDINVLSGLTNLRYLDLAYNSISNIDVLAGHTNLYNVALSGNSVSDISVLANLTNLQYLYLGNNSIGDLSVLAGLTNLQRLSLTDNDISDINVLANLTNLQYLYLGNNNISDICALAGLTNLQYLYLNANSISAVDQLTGLTGLRELYLQDNEISFSVDKLTGLQSAEVIDLTGNNNIPCCHLNELENALGEDVVTRPSECCNFCVAFPPPVC